MVYQEEVDIPNLLCSSTSFYLNYYNLSLFTGSTLTTQDTLSSVCYLIPVELWYYIHNTQYTIELCMLNLVLYVEHVSILYA